jgi:hypothetical protein
MPYIPPIRVVATRGYDRRARKLFSEAEEDLTDAEKREIRNLIAALEAEG